MKLVNRRLRGLAANSFTKFFGHSFTDRMVRFDANLFIDLLRRGKRGRRLGGADNELANDIFATVGEEPTDWLVAISRSFEQLVLDTEAITGRFTDVTASLARLTAIIDRNNKVSPSCF